MSATDKELLELAAKAAGYRIIADIDLLAKYESSWPKGFLIDNEMGSDFRWNPLINDGDALMLAVKLGLKISISHALDGAMAWTHLASAEEQLGDDPCAATRRAIVRAAAEIGRMM